MADPADIGARVLAGGERGRAEALKSRQGAARDLLRLVRAAAVRDLETRHSSVGRASRIARRLNGLVSERHVRRLLGKYPDTEGVVSELVAHNQNLPQPSERNHDTNHF